MNNVHINIVDYIHKQKKVKKPKVKVDKFEHIKSEVVEEFNKNINFIPQTKNISASVKRNKKDEAENADKSDFLNKTHKHSSYNEISILLNKNIKNNYKSKNKEKKRINMSKDFIDEKKNVLDKESPIKPNSKKKKPEIGRISNIKKNINNINNKNYNNSYIPIKKKKILIYNINSGLNANYNLYNNNINYKNNNNAENISLSISSRAINEEKKLDEILELKLINSRLKNEIQILTEKNKSLNEILEIKNKDIEIIKNKNDKFYNELNNELILLKKKYEADISNLNKNYDKYISIIKSLISLIV
jgi:hypothetical protein